jgi:hypothetical protein
MKGDGMSSAHKKVMKEKAVLFQKWVSTGKRQEQ